MEKQYHIKLSSEDIGKYVILPGDPGRCKEIAKYFDEPKFVTSKYLAISLHLPGSPGKM